ncbi:unnamed protein product [Rotaria sordida]|uniref:Uncharacterized protein n=1 Tax=Rotaria sordida TaxID=392033 RepID=A0A814ZLL7_9BILA|nr:unnamed protein product [Rotaria sordida]CAF1527706.1 unnamed protein product [Rotaria sordida]
MSLTNIYLDTSRLPDDILSYTDQRFYDFVESFLGKLHSRLLAQLHISSVPCFLLTENPCAIFNMDIDDEILEKLSKEICVKLKNNQFIVKPGIENSFKCLKQLLSKKTEEKLKKKRKGQQRSTNLGNTISTQSSSFSSASISLSQPLSATNSLSLLTLDEHRQYLLNLIQQWCIDNKSSLQLNQLELKEGVDFTFFFLTVNDGLEATVECKCGSKISLGKNLDKIQLSNFYKHLKDTKCSNIMALKKKEEKHIQQSVMNPTTTPSKVTDDLITTVSSHRLTSSTSSPGDKKRRISQGSQEKQKKKKE